MRDALVVTALSILPRNRLAALMGWFARTRLSRWLTGLFVWAYGVNLAEAEPGPYPTLDALFTRRLRPGARPIDAAEDALVSPVDGAVAFVGDTDGGRFEVAPGRTVRLDQLLGEPVVGERQVCVLYLSPKDYHRVHVPREGRLTRWRYVPGTLWPVFPGAVARVEGLFARNERVVAAIATDRGVLHAVLVGAFGVGRIEVAWSDLLSNAGAGPRDEEADVALARGADLGVFHLGSTVILVAVPGAWRWEVRAGEAVRMGTRIAAAASTP